MNEQLQSLQLRSAFTAVGSKWASQQLVSWALNACVYYRQGLRSPSKAVLSFSLSEISKVEHQVGGAEAADPRQSVCGAVLPVPLSLSSGRSVGRRQGHVLLTVPSEKRSKCVSRCSKQGLVFMGTIERDKLPFSSWFGQKNLLELLWKQREEGVTGGNEEGELHVSLFDLIQVP